MTLISELNIFERIPPIIVLEKGFEQVVHLVVSVTFREYPVEIACVIAKHWINLTSPTLLSFLLQAVGPYDLRLLLFQGHNLSCKVWYNVMMEFNNSIVWQSADSPDYTLLDSSFGIILLARLVPCG